MPPSVKVMSPGPGELSSKTKTTTGKKTLLSARNNRPSSSSSSTTTRQKKNTHKKSLRKYKSGSKDGTGMVTEPGQLVGSIQQTNSNGVDESVGTLQDGTQLQSQLLSYGSGNGGLMYGSPYYGGMMMGGGGMMMGEGPFSGVYQWLFGVQNLVFSLGQVVTMLGSNQQAIQHVMDLLSSMVNSAITKYQELRALEARVQTGESKEQRQRRRRLKALRWALAAGSTWIVYKVVRRLFMSVRRNRKRQLLPPVANNNNNFGGAAHTNGLLPTNYPAMGPYHYSPYYNSYPAHGQQSYGGGFGF